MYKYVKTYVRCQRALQIPKYRIFLCMPLTGLLQTFSINFAGPFRPVPDNERYLLISVEHLKSCPMVCATNNATDDDVSKLVERKMLHPFGPSETTVSDNDVGFTDARVSYLLA